MDKILRITSIQIEQEQDVVLARQRARHIAEYLAFDTQDQTRISTAVSEIARNAYQYASGGLVEFSLAPFEKDEFHQAFTVRISDRGPGIDDVKKIMEGRYVSKTGLGVGLLGAHRLMDSCRVDSAPGIGTSVMLQKVLTKKSARVPASALSEIAAELSKKRPESPLREVQQQNQELVRALDEVRSAQTRLAETNEALNATNLELEETNRGVVALYTELDEKAEDLRKANELKSRFLSYVSHEFRTPINSILGLSRLLLDRVDGGLTLEQEKQVGFIHKAANDVLEMVNDLLDLGKVEAGKTTVQAKAFEMSDLLTTIRGLMRPLMANPDVELIIEEPREIGPLRTDEGKLGQILRNLISNALKFTERGSVRVSTEMRGSDRVAIRVADTGIGIAPENQSRIFEEYSQIDSPIQSKVKGTGLGLPLVKRFAELLGGSISLESRPGVGSVFTILLPIDYPDGNHGSAVAQDQSQVTTPPHDRLALVIDDDETSRYLLKDLLSRSPYSILEAKDGYEGLERARMDRPDVIFLDVVMPGIGAFEVLRELKADPKTVEIPVVIRTSKVLSIVERERLLASSVAVLSKSVPSREKAIEEIHEALRKVGRAV